MIAAIYARKSTEQTGVRKDLPSELREYLVAKLAEILALDYRQTRTDVQDEKEG